MTFGERLRELRTAAGLTQRGLYQRCGVRQVCLSRYEHGATVPRAGTLRRLAGALRIPVEELLAGVENVTLREEKQDAEKRRIRREPSSPVGNRLAELRRARGLTQKELAAAAGVTAAAVCRWERGNRDIPTLTLAKLCRAMGLEPSAFFTGLEL